MSVVVELDVPSEAFLLADTMERVPDVQVDIVRVVSGRPSVTPYIWAYGDRIDSFAQAIGHDSSVEEAISIDERSVTDPERDDQIHEGLFRVRWIEEQPPLVASIADRNGALLHASYNGTREWELTVLLPERDSLSGLHDDARELDVGFDLRRVYGAHEANERGTYGITQEQYEALVAAYRAGYFEVPRDHTLSEIASDLGISANALSARLRRGYRCLLSNTLIENE